MTSPVICSAAHRCPYADDCYHGKEKGHEMGNMCYSDLCNRYKLPRADGLLVRQRVQCVPVYSHVGGDDEALERVRAAIVGEAMR